MLRNQLTILLKDSIGNRHIIDVSNQYYITAQEADSSLIPLFIFRGEEKSQIINIQRASTLDELLQRIQVPYDINLTKIIYNDKSEMPSEKCKSITLEGLNIQGNSAFFIKSIQPDPKEVTLQNYIQMPKEQAIKIIGDITRQAKITYREQHINAKPTAFEDQLQNKPVLTDHEKDLLIIKQTISSAGTPVYLDKKSSPISQTSLLNMSAGFLQDTYKITVKKQKKGQLVQAERKQIIKIKAEQFGCGESDISIIFEDDCEIQLALTNPTKLDSEFGQSSGLESDERHVRQIPHPFFEFFVLSADDFDPKGNIDFVKDHKATVQERGGQKYLQPDGCTRYGLKVMNMFDKDQKTRNDWLAMDGRKGEWAVAYHGVYAPMNNCPNGKKVMESIVGGIKTENALIAGQRQLYQNYETKVRQPDGSFKKEIVGRGIYCAPKVETALGYAEKCGSGEYEYQVVFQCRVNPYAIKKCNNDKYWVINQSKNIRPYGILLKKKGSNNSQGWCLLF